MTLKKFLLTAIAACAAFDATALAGQGIRTITRITPIAPGPLPQCSEKPNLRFLANADLTIQQVASAVELCPGVLTVYTDDATVGGECPASPNPRNRVYIHAYNEEGEWLGNRLLFDVMPKSPNLMSISRTSSPTGANNYFDITALREGLHSLDVKVYFAPDDDRLGRPPGDRVPVASSDILIYAIAGPQPLRAIGFHYKNAAATQSGDNYKINHVTVTEGDIAELTGIGFRPVCGSDGRQKALAPVYGVDTSWTVVPDLEAPDKTHEFFIEPVGSTIRVRVKQVKERPATLYLSTRDFKGKILLHAKSTP